MFIFEDPDPPKGAGHSQEGLVIAKTCFWKCRLLILNRMFILGDPDPPEGAGHSQEGLVITKT